MTPYLARLLAITINNATIPSECQKAIVVAIYKGGDRSLVSNYRPASLTSVVSKQMKHVIVSHLREIWAWKDWIFEGQHGLQPGFSCESQIITVSQAIADPVDKGVRTDAIVIDFSSPFDLVPHDRLPIKIAASGVDPRVVVWVREFLLGPTHRVGGQLSEEVRVTSGVLQGSILGPYCSLCT
jgi:hypothetical protein